MSISMWDEKKIRIVDIENELGVRTAAASNVIHGKTKEISDTTVRKVQKMLAERGHLPNIAAALSALIILG
ncbi:LacI family DNA-binding transcriptional regulator [Sharpea azabuensis]|uniref:LacI family DNA-binding transcriptional regulator n=1 Tax=Sharpea azabuensis TaxID=322505 RepID=UPI001568B2CF|nr:LacI family DNA-binding transcriptional regulator [Sharpea azabuensis]